MISYEEAQELHLLVGGPLEVARQNGTLDPEYVMVKASELERARELAAILVSDSDPDNQDLMQTVTFEWSTEKGRCYDCGLPAAYRLPQIPVADGEDFLLCSVCAAYHASHGDEIEYLFNDDVEEEPQ